MDNTLFDWFEVWYQSFSAMLDVVVARSGLSRQTMLLEIREVHQRRGTSEYSYLLQELPSLTALEGEIDLQEVYSEAIHAYRSARKRHLRLYPGVAETLADVKAAGASVVAYTESLGFHSRDRVKRLGLDGIIDVLYSPNDHSFPAGVSPEDLRSGTDSEYELSLTRRSHTPRGSIKPNAEVLLSILEKAGVAPHAAVYVGDSLMKDIAMAQDAGVLDVHAKYGEVQGHEGYELLRSVSHWTQEDVERELALISQPTIVPTHTLTSGFAELMDLVSFSAF
jgi:phosphoglycolate phosphatase-like HAD superfamily hydrolase